MTSRGLVILNLASWEFPLRYNGLSAMQAKYKVTEHFVDRFGNPETPEEAGKRLAREASKLAPGDPLRNLTDRINRDAG
jgi:hypothetical protein